MKEKTSKSALFRKTCFRSQKSMILCGVPGGKKSEPKSANKFSILDGLARTGEKG
jgi:hypothetical protein